MRRISLKNGDHRICITTIHKKRSMDVCDNYRGIAVLVTVSRICGKLVKGKIEDEYCDMEAEEQTDLGRHMIASRVRGQNTCVTKKSGFRATATRDQSM